MSGQCKNANLTKRFAAWLYRFYWIVCSIKICFSQTDFPVISLKNVIFAFWNQTCVYVSTWNGRKYVKLLWSGRIRPILLWIRNFIKCHLTFVYLLLGIEMQSRVLSLCLKFLDTGKQSHQLGFLLCAHCSTIADLFSFLKLKIKNRPTYWFLMWYHIWAIFLAWKGTAFKFFVITHILHSLMYEFKFIDICWVFMANMPS